MKLNSEGKNKLKILRCFIIPLIIFLFFSFSYLRSTKLIPIQYWDEYNWVSRSYFFDLLIKGDLKNPLWQHYYGYNQPKMTEYVFGAVLYPFYLKFKTYEFNKNKDFVQFLIDYSFYEVDCDGRLSCEKYNGYLKNTPTFVKWKVGDTGTSENLINKYGSNILKTIKLIFSIREFNSIILALNVLVIYFIFLFFSEFGIAILTAGFFGINRLIVDSSLVATSESIFLFLFNLGLLLLILIFSRKKQNYILFLLFSLIAALCAQTKLNGFMLLIIFFFFMLNKVMSLLVHRKYLQTRNESMILIIVPLITYLTFIALNPFLYSNPIRNTIIMFNNRWNASNKQTAIFYQDKLPNFISRIYTINNKLLIKNKGGILNNAVSRINIGYLLPAFNSMLFVLGIAVACFGKLKKKFVNLNRLTLTIFILIQVIMGFYLKLDWERYLIQLVVFIIFFQILGLTYLYKFVKMKIKSIFK